MAAKTSNDSFDYELYKKIVYDTDLFNLDTLKEIRRNADLIPDVGSVSVDIDLKIENLQLNMEGILILAKLFAISTNCSKFISLNLGNEQVAGQVMGRDKTAIAYDHDLFLKLFDVKRLPT